MPIGIKGGYHPITPVDPIDKDDIRLLSALNFMALLRTKRVRVIRITLAKLERLIERKTIYVLLDLPKAEFYDIL